MTPGECHVTITHNGENMKILVFVIFAACGLLAAASDFEFLEDEAFLQWVDAFQPDSSAADLQEIYPQWKKNAEFVEKHNSLGLSYTLSMNQFGHLSAQDLPKTKVSPSPPPSSDNDASISVETLPSSVDWREAGAVGPVKDQGQVGGASVFAVVDAIDGFWAIKHGHLGDASDQQYNDCCARNHSGFGGAYDCVVKIGGLASEGAYYSPDRHCKTFLPVVVKISGGSAVTPAGNERALKAAVFMQPIAAGVDASHTSFQLYHSGVYAESACSSTKLDHGVLIVGYGSMEGQDYWILKNSWNTRWGMEGYMLLARNRNNMCGIATAASYPY